MDKSKEIPMQIRFQTTVETSSDADSVNMTVEEGRFYTRSKLRFKEVFEERKTNLQWRKSLEENVLYNEIRETPDNREEVQKAKEKELENLKFFKVYDEVKEEGQHILGSRYVITQKPDGNFKARFVVKGFQEVEDKQTDSPTAGRESVKLVCSIIANEKWPIEASDVRSAFLQSENLNRDVFILPPPEMKKKTSFGN